MVMSQKCCNFATNTKLQTFMKRFLLSTILFFAVVAVYAQVTVSGVVTDRQNGRPLAHVSITAEGTDVHTVTNDDGRFTLKVTSCPKHILLSHIGFKSRRIPLTEGQTGNLQLTMVGSTVELSEIIVSADDPIKIVLAAMNRIETNYAHENELVRCFYRETARRGSRFISVAEAVTEMYKTDYSVGPDFDGVAIRKGRRLMSMKARDTLAVKIQGGPVTPLFVDVAKNREYLLNPDNLIHYTLRMEAPTMIDDRLHYVIRMTPSTETIYARMGGLLYIDQQTLAITRAELQLDVSDWRRASDYMLVRKPLGLHFRPKELSVTVVYQTDEQGVTRMSYVRNEMRFTCDWKRRLFSSPFTTVSEMVVTDRLKQGRDAKRPRGHSSFSMRERFYDRVEFFEDPDFWSDYNIIEPTESLEHAISRLKKNQNHH